MEARTNVFRGSEGGGPAKQAVRRQKWGQQMRRHTLWAAAAAAAAAAADAGIAKQESKDENMDQA